MPLPSGLGRKLGVDKKESVTGVTYRESAIEVKGSVPNKTEETVEIEPAREKHRTAAKMKTQLPPAD